MSLNATNAGIDRHECSSHGHRNHHNVYLCAEAKECHDMQISTTNKVCHGTHMPTTVKAHMSQSYLTPCRHNHVQTCNVDEIFCRHV